MENILLKIKEKQNLAFLEKLSDDEIDIYAFGGLLRDIFLKRKWEDVDLRIVINKERDERENLVEKLLNEYNLEGKIPIEDLNLTVYRFLPEGSLSKEQIDLSLVSSLKDNLPDFTINSLFFDLKKEKLIDIYGGIDDLSLGKIRTVKEPNIHFKEEPHMMFRAVKFACQLNFEIENKTFNSIIGNSNQIQKTFKFIEDEKKGIFVELFLGNIFKGLKSNPIKYFELLNKTNLFNELKLYLSKKYKIKENVDSIEPKDLGSYEKNISHLFSSLIDNSDDFTGSLIDMAISTPKEYSDFNIAIDELTYLK